MPEDIRCKVVTWSEIDHWAEKVACKMEASGYTPDVVVGLTRGGWVPARILCDQLVCKNLFSIKVEHWGITARTDNKAKLVQELAVDIKGKKVLLVDDITDTGESLKLSIDHVKSKGPADVKCATLLHINHSKTVPDFYGVEVKKENWRWFIFPWNFKEDLGNLIGKLDGAPKDPQTIKKMLKKCYEITSTKPVDRAVADYLKHRI
ncbi:MAG: phosphoribosyltransferase [Methanobacteriota archaeon]